MLRYVEALVTFSEIPDEITLCLNISGCKIHCPACHSKYLWDDIGDKLTKDALLDLLTSNSGITCVCFMGGDHAPEEIFELSDWIHESYNNKIKTAWYSGMPKIRNGVNTDYVKVGPYIEELGPLTSPTTNQRLYVLGKHLNKMDANPNMYYDITDKFWKNDSNS